MRALAKITAKGQTTIPREIRLALKAGPGDTLLWEMGAQGEAVVRRVQPLDIAYLGARCDRHVGISRSGSHAHNAAQTA